MLRAPTSSAFLTVMLVMLGVFAPSAHAATGRSVASPETMARIQKTLPAAKGMQADAGAAALVDLMLHVPASVRFALARPATAYDEVRLAPINHQTAVSAAFAAKLRETTTLSLAPETEALGARLLQPKESAAPALAAANTGAMRPEGRRVGAVSDEGRVFWYSMGASALTSLGIRVFLFFPAVLIALSFAAFGASLGPVAMMVMLVGLFGGIAVIDAALAALAGAFVFDSMSRYYDGNFLGAFLGQAFGTGIAVAAVGIMVGFGALYIAGINAVVQFVGTQIIGAVVALSVLGIMPVVVLGFFATVVFPAMGGAWGLALTARPIEGFKIDPTWDPELLTERARPKGLEKADRRVFAPLRVAIPGT